MGKSTPWKTWLKAFNAVIDSPTPRRVSRELNLCLVTQPHIAPSLDDLELFLNSLVRLRNSKCYGRYDFEDSFTNRSLSCLIYEIKFGSEENNKLPLQLDLFDEPQSKDNEPLSEEAVNKLRAIARYCLEGLKATIKKEPKKHVRKNRCFQILAELSEFEELNEYLEETLKIATNSIKRKYLKIAGGAVRFIAYYHYYRGLDLPDEIDQAINHVKDQADRELIRDINYILANLNFIDEFTAFVEWDDLDDDEDF